MNHRELDVTSNSTDREMPDTDALERARAELAELRNGPWHRDGAWSVSSHNFCPEAKPPQVARSVQLVDITGRVIEQIPGIALSPEEKVSLISALARAGIPAVHPGLRIGSAETARTIQLVRDEGLSIRLVALVYSLDDVRRAADVGADIAEVVTVSRPGLNGVYREFSSVTESDAVASSMARLELAKELGLVTHADMNLISYARLGYVREFTAAARDLGVDLIQIADGSGGLGPRATHHIVSVIRSVAPDARIGLHLHDDLGLALPNALAGLEAGAESFDVSVHGTGERAGQLDLGQFGLVSTILYGCQTGIDFSRLVGLSKLVEDLTRTPLPGTRPIVGDYAFDTSVESVIKHEHWLDELVHMPLSADLVGATRTVQLGRNTGKFGLMLKAEQLGLDVSTADLDQVSTAIQEWFVVHKRLITDGEFGDLVRQHTRAEQ